MSLGQKIAEAVGWVGREMVMPAAEKMIPQGASEFSQALFTGSAYMPYGPTNDPVQIPETPALAEAAVASPEASTPAMEIKQPEIEMEMGG